MAEAAVCHEVHLKTGVRSFVCIALACLSLVAIEPRLFVVTFSDIPFALTDYLFFLVGGLGFFLVPRASRPQSWSPVVPIGLVGGFLTAALFAKDQVIAAKGAVGIGMMCLAAMGFSRFAADAGVRRVFWWLLAAIWIKWTCHVLLMMTDFAFSSGAHAGRLGPQRYDHNFVGLTLSYSGAAIGGCLLMQRSRIAHAGALLVFLLTMTLNMACFTRSGVLAMGALILVACARSRAFQVRTVTAAMVAVLLVGWMVFVVQTDVFTDRVQGAQVRYDPTAIDYHDQTTRTRRLLLKKAWLIAQEFPTALIGIGMYGYRDYHLDAEDMWIVEGLVPHNSHIQMLVEGGLIAFCAWLYLLRRASLRGIKGQMTTAYDDGIVVSGLLYCMFIVMLDAAGMIFWLLMAMSYASIQARDASEHMANASARTVSRRRPHAGLHCRPLS